MHTNRDSTFGNTFERIIASLLAITTGITLIYLAIEGPLFHHHIRYKTAEIINNQLIGQDIVNIFLLSPMLIIGGVGLFFKKQISRYLLIMTPLYLIYYVLSYTIGWEWSASKYTGNSELYTYHFLFILISSLVLLLYSLSIFPKNVQSNFKRKGLVLYSFLFSFFLLIFASMWIQEIQEVMSTGTARAYDLAPAAFWLVRIFDLGFSIPLGFISVYLLWTRPNTTYPIQFMFYGFFLTMIVAVNAMGLVMLLKNDPTFLMRDMIVFLMLALIVFVGFVYVVRHYEENRLVQKDKYNG
ncbi:MAG: hypothetical protein NTV54_10785 [Ignavibacteriales bacterium]|nr:hypothetical protein [Ignavibacteriales bacterium]